MMEFDSCFGYGYSVWYVPNNYKEMQEQYGIAHLPHITLETNLSLKDAYHIYHSACNKIIVKFRDGLVKFPSFYHHDPLVYYGWYVDVLQMAGRKLNWSPHMTVQYLPRATSIYPSQPYNDHHILSRTNAPPMGPIECFVVIADTRSGVPTDWHMDHMYFNIKASQSFSLSFDTKPKSQARLISNCTEKYIGTNFEEIETLPQTIRECMMSCGIVASDDEVKGIVTEVRNELLRNKNKGTPPFTDYMDIDKSTKPVKMR